MQDTKFITGGITALILAAGESRRMGAQNKLLLPVAGEHMLVHVVKAVTASSAAQSIAIVGHEARRVQAALAGFPLRVVLNPDFEQGMGTSIRAGVLASPDSTPGFLVCLSDMPMITAEEYDEIIDFFLSKRAVNPQSIVIPTYNGRRGNPVLLSDHYRPAMALLDGAIGCREIIKSNQDQVYLLPMKANHVLQDVDTKEAWETLRDTRC